MITAIPVTKKRLAAHFTKAEQFNFYDDKMQLIDPCMNPAASDETCAGKNALLSMLMEHKTVRVVVRNIGQRMLGKLLTFNVGILEASTSDLDAVLQLLKTQSDLLVPLTDESQGRPSLKHDQQGHECEHHHHQGDQSCCHSADNHQVHSCCGRHEHGYGVGHCCKHQHGQESC